MSDSDEKTIDTDGPVSAEWLATVLGEHHRDPQEPASITILDFSVTPGCDAGESVLSDILAVSVKYCVGSNPTPTSHDLCFIVKLLPQDPFSRFFVTEAQFDLREIKFYTQIVPDLIKFKKKNLIDGPDIELAIPECYYAHYSQEGNADKEKISESVLVLENIKLNGFVGIDFSRGLTLRQTEAAVESIAQLHALSLCYKIKEAKCLTGKYPFLFQTTRASDSYQQLIERGLPQLSEFLERKPGLSDIIAALNDLRPHTKDIIESLLAPEEPMALITHTDFWCNNLMFREDETNCHCSILDWQMVTYSRATNDLALLLVSSIPTELRRLHTSKLLDIYWEILCSTCKRLGLDVETKLEYTRNDLEEDYKRSQLLALLLCIGSIDLAIGNPQTEDRLLELLHDLYKDGLLQPDIVNKSIEV